jgi:acyl-coenzyme A thioesterase PaaI-like protein
MDRADSNHRDHTPQPNSSMCFVCGVSNSVGLALRFFNDGPNACRADVIIDDRYQGYPGVAHGGIVATMLDEAMGRAALSGNPARFMYTARIEVRYRHHVPLRQLVSITARLDKDRGRVATASAELRLADGTVAAEASATLMEIPRAELDKLDPAALGWKVYP